MTAATVDRILNLYGLTAAEHRSIEKGYRNESHPVRLTDGRMINLILYKREPRMLERVRRTNDLMSFLSEKGLPVRYPIDHRIIRIRDSGGSLRYAALYDYLPGDTIPWEAYTMEHIKLLGQWLAGLHRAMDGYDASSYHKVTHEYAAIFQRMDEYFFRKDIAGALARKLQLAVPRQALATAVSALHAYRGAPSQQLLHMDFVRSNILFATGPLRLAGILDFEKAAVGHPFVDIARTLAFLLVDCKYKSEDKVRKYFLLSGYQKRGGIRLITPGTSGHVPALERLVSFFLLYDLYKFLRHNPYECLPQNEHFVRTRDLLLQRGVITTTNTGSSRAESLLQ